MKFRKPMLAHNFNEKHIAYPCYVQPKIDGVRCITDGRTFWSRNGKKFPQENFDHLRRTIRFPYLVDGELSLKCAGINNFEGIVSVVKRAAHRDAHRLTFNTFDVMTDETFGRRWKMLESIFRAQNLGLDSRWQRLETYLAKDRKAVTHYHKIFLQSHYEGTMVRNTFGRYVSARSRDLLKWKELIDMEYIIVDVKEAKGKDAGTPIFVCAVHGDTTFRVRPMGTMTERRAMWKSRRKLTGKLLTVTYQNLTKYGIPRFPRGKAIRDYE